MNRAFLAIFVSATLILLLLPEGAALAAAFDPEAATEAYLASVPAEDRAASDAYFEGGYWLILWNLLYGLAVAWILLASPLSRRMRDFAEKRSKRKFLQTALYALQYLLVTFVLGFPITVYQGFIREHQYDLSNMAFGPWFGEQLIGLGVGLVIMGFGIAVLYMVMRKSGARWWLWGGAVSTVGLAFLIMFSPVFIAPLFNDYTPMEEGPLKAEIISMARANGVPAGNVYVVDQSRQTSRISANVQGMFGTLRISLNDNLLEGGTTAEIKAVMAHELGHYLLGHIASMIIQIGLLLMVGFAFVAWSFDRARARWGANWGIRDITDPAGMPLLFALLSVYFFLATPVFNSIIRVNEVQADIFGLNVAREPDGFATIALKLGKYRKLDPGHWEEIIFYDHPSGRSRISMSMRWKAENLPEESAD
ncbi:MAG: M48 family metallopeptidase [Proteobacteria bacterium]|nr:M48 family metallopeptidase [Pseudomonadota bacterium]